MATWTSRYLESEREQRNSGWSRSAHRPIKRISEHRDTISCHPLCCTNDLIDMKGRCFPKIIVWTHPSKFVYIQATTTHERHRTENSASVTTISLLKKGEVDIISLYKWWINEELHRWSFDKPLKIVYHWYLKYILTQTFFLVIAQWHFHSTWSTISFQKIRRKQLVRKISIGIYFHILTQYKPIVGRISACHGI